MRKLFLVLMIISGLLMASCQVSTPTELAVLTPNPNVQSYPVPVGTASPTGAYPAPVQPAQSAYPVPSGGSVESTIPVGNIVPFRINRPVLNGATSVTGTGMPGVPLMLVNVTNIGEVIAETTIKDDGTYLFEIQPLIAGTRIGLMIGNLDNTPWSLSDFYNAGFNGEEASNLPNVGFLYDSYMVK